MNSDNRTEEEKKRQADMLIGLFADRVINGLGDVGIDSVGEQKPTNIQLPPETPIKGMRVVHKA